MPIEIRKFENQKYSVVLLISILACVGSVVAHDVVTPATPPHPEDADHWAWHNLCDAAGDNCTEPLIQRYGYSLIQYPRPLQRGDNIKPYGAPESTEPLECEHICSLYFLDLRPGAHFAHPTVIGLYDWETGEFQAQRGRWWPVVNGTRHVFDTVRERVRFSIDAQAGEYGLPKRKPHRPPTLLSPDINISPPAPGVGGASLVGAPCKVYALVINGYDDPTDTFDEDTDGIYTVLRGMGVPDDQIFFLSPIASDWRDHPTSKANIQTAISEIAAKANMAGECSELVLFISTHGKTDELNLMPIDGQHEFLADTVFGPWLATITGCPKWTVIIEACESLSLDDQITIAAGGADLRSLYSAGHGIESWGDIDENDSNPEDIGSETIWGYVEAFGTSNADVTGSTDPANPADQRLSFTEAYQYAEANDASKVGGLWMAVADPGLYDLAPPHACCGFPVGLDVAIESDGVTTKKTKTVSPYGKTQVVRRCTNAPVWVTVKNRGTETLPVGTLRLYGRTIKADGTPSSGFAPYANMVLLGGLEGGQERTFKLRWGVRPIFKKNQRVELMAMLDTPLAPVWDAPLEGGGPNPGSWAENRQACQCDLSVVKRCLPIVGCDCRKYVKPEIVLP